MIEIMNSLFILYFVLNVCETWTKAVSNFAVGVNYIKENIPRAQCKTMLTQYFSQVHFFAVLKT